MQCPFGVCPSASLLLCSRPSSISASKQLSISTVNGGILFVDRRRRSETIANRSDGEREREREVEGGRLQWRNSIWAASIASFDHATLTTWPTHGHRPTIATCAVAKEPTDFEAFTFTRTSDEINVTLLNERPERGAQKRNCNIEWGIIRNLINISSTHSRLYRKKEVYNNKPNISSTHSRLYRTRC